MTTCRLPRCVRCVTLRGKCSELCVWAYHKMIQSLARDEPFFVKCSASTSSIHRAGFVLNTRLLLECSLCMLHSRLSKSASNVMRLPMLHYAHHFSDERTLVVTSTTDTALLHTQTCLSTAVEGRQGRCIVGRFRRISFSGALASGRQPW